MKRLRMMLLALTVLAFGSTIAYAQQGYGQWERRGDGDHDRDDGYRRDGRYYADAAGAARQYGFQDGLSDGSNDRASGRRFRLNRNGNYRHGDHGYYHGFGDKDQYRYWYRQAYERGYQRGYNSGGYDDPRYGWRR